MEREGEGGAGRDDRWTMLVRAAWRVAAALAPASAVPRGGPGSGGWRRGSGGTNGEGTRGGGRGALFSEPQQPIGPAGDVVHGARLQFDDAVTLKLRRRARLVWDEPPKDVLLVKRWRDAPAANATREVAEWFRQRGVQVHVERVVQEKEMPECHAFDAATSRVDFCVTLGGDGTMLHLAGLFAGEWNMQSALPPVISFGMGSLGFLTPFPFEQYQDKLARIMAAHKTPLYVTLRTRLRCEVYEGQELKMVTHVLNELAVDRGSNPALSTLDCYIDGNYVTTVHADGLLVATPSGSTAYNMAAGGAMVAPSVPCTLLTPLAAHSLSFRPFIVPESSHIELKVPHNARTDVIATFDGRNTVSIPRGGSVKIATSEFPIPIINMHRYDIDWFNSLTHKLSWNTHATQLPLERP